VFLVSRELQGSLDGLGGAGGLDLRGPADSPVRAERQGSRDSQDGPDGVVGVDSKGLAAKV